MNSEKEHQYQVSVQWTGNTGTGTSNYRAYERSHQINVPKKAAIFGSSDPAFRGDETKHNPEELLVAAISSCHMLWYLHLCATAGVVVIHYEDHAVGKMIETINGSGHFTEVVLQPVITITEHSMFEKAKSLHDDAHRLCFIANSVNFLIQHAPTIIVQEA